MSPGVAHEIHVKDLKEKSIRGGFVGILGRAANFLFRLDSLVVLARMTEQNGWREE